MANGPATFFINKIFREHGHTYSFMLCLYIHIHKRTKHIKTAYIQKQSGPAFALNGRVE